MLINDMVLCEELFHTPSGVACADFITEGHRETWPIRSKRIRALPREQRELMIAANNGHLLAFDNLSGLPAWLSDALCRLASGGSFAVRQLYTDDDEVLFKAARPNPQKANQNRSKPNQKRKRSLDDGYRTIIIAQIPRQLSSTSNFFCSHVFKPKELHAKAVFLL
jgi:hypothetical protein